MKDTSLPSCKYLLLKIALLFFAFLAVNLIFGKPVFAQADSTDSASITQKYGIAFPITELGGCTDYVSCRNYCEDPLNSGGCTDYAKVKGFHSEENLEDEEFIKKAQSALGCDSFASCQNYCEVPANYEKCNSFAQERGVGGGYVADPGQVQILTTAKEILGCDSRDSCQTLCSNQENAQKCTQFAQQTGLRGGEHMVGPGGCTSESTCQNFCSDPNNFQICSGFHNVSGATFSGPGGCTNEQSCRTFCQENSEQCSSFGGSQSGSVGSSPQEMCNKTPNCSWAGDTCQCGFYGETRESQNRAQEYASFCTTNPDQCKVGPGGYPIPSDKAQNFSSGGSGQNYEQDYGKYCRENPDKCRAIENSGTGGGYGGSQQGDHAAACARYGCSWTGNSCQCTGINPQPTPGNTGTGDYTPPSNYTGPTPGSGTYTPPSSYSGSGTYTPPSNYTGPTPGSGTYTPPSNYDAGHTPPASYTPPSSYDSSPPPPPSGYESSPPPPPSGYAPPPPPSGYESSPPPPPSGEVHGAKNQNGFLRTLINLLLGR